MSNTSDGFKGQIPTASAFLFTVDDVQIGVFSEVSGLEVTIEVETYREGGENGFVHKLPGHMTWPHIVLKRGVCDSDALFAWVGKTAGTGFTSAGNKVERSTGAITAIDDAGNELRSWNLEDVMAVKWTGPRFAVSSGEPLTEEVELAHHGFTSKTYK